MQNFSEFLGVDKDDSLCHFTDVEDFFDEVWLLSRLAQILELAYVVKLKFLFVYGDLLSLLYYGGDLLLYLLGVSCAKQDVLHWFFKFRYVFGHDLSQVLKVSFFSEENVRLIDYETSQF